MLLSQPFWNILEASNSDESIFQINLGWKGFVNHCTIFLFTFYTLRHLFWDSLIKKKICLFFLFIQAFIQRLQTQVQTT